jgi:hypothetical protein
MKKPKQNLDHPQPSPFCEGNGTVIDSQFWPKAPEHPRDVVMRILASENCC